MAQQKFPDDGEAPARCGGQSEKRLEYVIKGVPLRVCDMPERMRPREEMSRLGVRNVSDDILLAIILRSGVRGINVVDLSRRLLVRYGSLGGIAAVSETELAREPGVGPVKAQVILAALDLARRLNEECAPVRSKIRTPEEAARILRDRVKALDNEVFWVLLLDSKNHLKSGPVEVTKGLLDASLVHPREVFRESIRTATAAVVLAHNHPSGDPNPSSEDIRITKQLVEAGRIVDIKVLDHVILGRQTEGIEKDFVSMREAGIVDFGV